MSDEQTVNVEVKVPEKKGNLQRAREWLGHKIAGDEATERMRDTWDRIHRVGGFLPVFVEGRLELRLKKMQDVLSAIEKKMLECKNADDLLKAIFKSNVKVYMLFHLSGTQWIRQLKNRRLAKKVIAYLEFFQRTVDREPYSWDLFTVSMEMCNISFLPEDVESVPPYLIETKTTLQPQQAKVSMDEVKEY